MNTKRKKKKEPSGGISGGDEIPPLVKVTTWIHHRIPNGKKSHCYIKYERFPTTEDLLLYTKLVVIWGASAIECLRESW